MCPSASACSAYDYMSGWLNQSYNPETNAINNSKYCGEYTRNPDANGEDVFIAYPLGGGFDLGAAPFFNMKVYGPPTSIYASFQTNGGSEVAGFAQNIWQNNTWQQINFDLTPFQAGAMSVDRVVFFFDLGMVNWDSYYIDDVGLSTAPVSVNNLGFDFNFDVYPNPLNEESIVAFSVRKNSFVKIELLDMQGKVLSVLMNKRLAPNTYSVDVSSGLPNGIYLLKASADGSIITKKVIVNN